MKERFYTWLAYKLPKRVVYWATIRLYAKATTEKYSNRTPDSVTIFEALDVWDKE